MNFADILEKWDRREARTYIKDDEKPKEDLIAKHQRLLYKKPDAVIDLHGLTQDEAWDALSDFFDKSRSMGLEKLLVIHGKGNHSTRKARSKVPMGSRRKEAVLKEVSRKFIELCPFAGEMGSNSSSAGGSGATWVLLKS